MGISGDLVVVGAPREASSSGGIDPGGVDDGLAISGAAYVFQRSGASWSHAAMLKSAVPAASDQFGTSVDASGNRVVVGAHGESSNAKGVNGSDNNNDGWSSGATYVFVGADGGWAQEAYLKASNGDLYDNLGGKLSPLSLLKAFK